MVLRLVLFVLCQKHNGLRSYRLLTIVNIIAADNVALSPYTNTYFPTGITRVVRGVATYSICFIPPLAPSSSLFFLWFFYMPPPNAVYFCLPSAYTDKKSGQFTSSPSCNSFHVPLIMYPISIYLGERERGASGGRSDCIFAVVFLCVSLGRGIVRSVSPHYTRGADFCVLL